MTEKQLFGAIVRGVGLYFACQALVQVIMILSMILAQGQQVDLGNLSWIFNIAVYVVIGLLLLVRPQSVVELCYRGNKSQD